MTCYHPQKAFRALGGGVTFVKNKGIGNMTLPCTQCIGCRLERSRQWAVRCTHEAALHSSNSFITLTYDDNNLPYDHSLVKPHFQKFMKRLRKANGNKTIRFYQSGEYGEASPENDFIARPHYHAILFNHDFNDKLLFSECEGIQLFTSDTLDNIWGKGFTSVGDVTFESAAYVARYIMKKVNGDKAHGHYERTDFATGEIFNIQPEYATMSRRSGIGEKWYQKYKADCYPSDSLSIRGSVQRPPKYYDTLHDRDPLNNFHLIKDARLEAMSHHKADNTDERLLVRESIKRAQTLNLNRKL